MTTQRGPRKFDSSLVDKLTAALQKPITVSEPNTISGIELVRRLAPLIKEQHEKKGISYEQIREYLHKEDPSFNLSVFSIREYMKNYSTKTTIEKPTAPDSKKGRGRKPALPSVDQEVKGETQGNIYEQPDQEKADIKSAKQSESTSESPPAEPPINPPSILGKLNRNRSQR